jgi:DNA-binding winged helix-turn-helix (wHTH) protein
VPKDPLLETVWPETAISESSLTGCIWEVRQAQGDAARTTRYIETVHGRGYRFIAPLTKPTSPEARQQSTLEPPQVAPGWSVPLTAPLAAPEMPALLEMIAGPAAAAGLRFEGDLRCERT